MMGLLFDVTLWLRYIHINFFSSLKIRISPRICQANIKFGLHEIVQIYVLFNIPTFLQQNLLSIKNL